MTGLILAVVSILLPWAVAAPQEDPGRDQPTLMLDFVVTDRAGAPVRDLQTEDVEVWIGHFRAPVRQLAHVSPDLDEAPGRVIVLLLDNLSVRDADLPRAREVARRLVTTMRPGDRMSIVRFSGTSMEATDDHARLLGAIDSYTIRATAVVRADILGEDVLKNVTALSRQISEVGGRKTIVAIGPGSLFDRPLPPPTAGRDLAPEWIDAMAAMASAHVNLYVIDPSGLGPGRVIGTEDGFARATGGRAFVNTNDFTGAVDRIVRDTSDYYVVRVPDPPNRGGKGSLRPVDVRVHRPGVTVLARMAIP